MSEPAAKPRQPIDLDEFERRLRGPEPARAQQEDPLAELARLVEGNRDPFAPVFNADGRQRPRVVHDSNAAPRQAPPSRYEEVQTPQNEAYGAANSDWQLRGSAYQEPQSHGGYAPAGYENHSDPSWEAEDQAWMAQQQMDAPRRSSLARYALVGAVVVVVGGIGATFAMRGGHTTSSEAPTIKASVGPLKVAPEGQAQSSDANRSASVLDRTNGDKVATSRVVTSEEQPVDLARVRAATPPAQPTAQGPSGQPIRTVGGPGTSAFPDPIKVRTVSVRPDGTIIANDSAAMAALTTGSAPQPVPPARPVATSTATAMTTASTPAVPKPATPKSTTRAVTTPVSPPSASEVVDSLGSAPVRPKAPVLPKPIVNASVEPVRVLPAAGYAVQLAAAGSDAEAREKAGKLERQFASAISGHHAGVVKGDVNGKPVWRVRLGGLNREDALSICSRIKESGGACFVASN